MRRKVSIVILSGILFGLLFCSSAYAIDMEYYTYNAFDPIVSAFQRIALIFSDSAYQSVFFVVMVCGALFGMFLMVMKYISGGRVSVAVWGVPMLIGFVIFAAMIVPKGNLYIYDPVKNRNTTVAGVPDGVVIVAGLLNRVERAFVDMIYTSGTPDEYQVQAGGVGFDMLYNIGNKSVIMPDKSVQASLRNYTNDCVFFEINRPGSTIQINALANNADFMAIFANAQNPAIYTTHFIGGGGEISATCTEAWAAIQSELNNPATLAESIRTKCADAGFDPTIPAELMQCRDALEGTINWLQGAAYTAEHIHRQAFMAQSLNDALLAASPDTAISVLASRNIGTSLVSSGVVANQWLPVIRGVITAVAIALIPFMIIFVPTPLAGKALAMCCGLFIWLTAWGVTDAIVHSLAMELGRKALYEASQYQLGLSAITNFSTGGLKALAAFGAVRWAGVMLATVITGMLIRVGGSAMAHLSGSLTSTATSQGQQAGMTAMTPEGVSRELNALESSVPTMANAGKFGFAERTAGATAQKFGGTQAQVEMVDHFGGIDGASQVYANATMARNIGFGAKGDGMRKFGFNKAYDANSFMSLSGLYEAGNMQSMYKDNPEALANRRTAAEAAFVTQAEGRGMRPDQLQSAISTMDIASTADFIDKYSKSQGVSFQEGASRLGEVLASQKFVGAQSYENARDVVSEQGMINTKTNEHLNEAAKFEMTYQLAHSLGLADNRQDFLGMYNHHKMHHGEDTLTLANQGAVDKLNAHMHAMGYNTSFKAGDRIRMGFDQQGRIQSAYATRGASRDYKDITNEMQGYHSQYLNFRESTTGSRDAFFNLTTSDTGHRGTHGSRVTTYDENTFVGVKQMRVDGKEGMYYVVEQKGRNGETIATTFRNGMDGSEVAIKTVNGEPQATHTTYHLNKGGNYGIKSENALSDRSVMLKGYAEHAIINPGTNQPVYSDRKRGQDTADRDTYLRDHRKSAEVNSGSILVGKDPVDYGPYAQGYLSTMGGLDWSVNKLGQVGTIRSFGKSGTTGGGRTQYLEKIPVMKRNTAPAPAQAPKVAD